MALKRLKAIRALQGISQDEIATLSGLSQSKLSRAERGYIQLNEDEKVRIANILDCDPTHLFPENKG